VSRASRLERLLAAAVVILFTIASAMRPGFSLPQ
jgi:hypothetical protein